MWCKNYSYISWLYSLFLQVGTQFWCKYEKGESRRVKRKSQATIVSSLVVLYLCILRVGKLGGYILSKTYFS
jgi:hypothetical protein